MVYIKNPYIFLLARLIQGICTGVFSAIVPLYINEIVTPDCTNLGSFNQILITFAQFFCYFLAYMLSLNQDMNASTSWKIIAEIPLITIIIQSVIFFFIFPF
jgi:MFS family permease